MSRQPLDPKPQARAVPRCRLVLNLDRSAALMHVVRTIMELTRYCREESTYRMWEAYYHGHAALLITHRERAELLAELFAERGLRVALEELT